MITKMNVYTLHMYNYFTTPVLLTLKSNSTSKPHPQPYEF